MKPLILLSGLILASMLTGCGGSSSAVKLDDITGKWFYNGRPVTINEQGEIRDVVSGPIWLLNFKKPGQIDLYPRIAGSPNRAIPGVIQMRDSKFIIAARGRPEMTFTQASDEAFHKARVELYKQIIPRNLSTIAAAARSYFVNNPDTKTITIGELRNTGFLDPTQIVNIPQIDLSETVLSAKGGTITVSTDGITFSQQY